MSGLVDRHISFLEALRAAGLPVSLAEDLDAIAALRALDWDRREVVRAGYAATLVKKQSQRPTFDALFDVYFPRMVGDGVVAAEREKLGAMAERPVATLLAGAVREKPEAGAGRGSLAAAAQRGAPDTAGWRLAAGAEAVIPAPPGTLLRPPA